MFKDLKYNRRSIRIPGYDYSQRGLCFVTICTQNREKLFGNVRNTKMHLAKAGEIAKHCWQQIPKHYPDTKLDKYTVMPNHVHGIIEITKPTNPLRVGNVGAENVGAENLQPHVGVQYFEPLQPKQNRFQKIIPRSLGCIIRGFKIGVTKLCRQNNYKNFIWQRNFYEHIIQDDESLENIRLYIQNNPREWHKDIENLAYQRSLIKQKLSVNIKNYYKNIFKRYGKKKNF